MAFLCPCSRLMSLLQVLGLWQGQSCPLFSLTSLSLMLVLCAWSSGVVVSKQFYLVLMAVTLSLVWAGKHILPDPQWYHVSILVQAMGFPAPFFSQMLWHLSLVLETGEKHLLSYKKDEFCFSSINFGLCHALGGEHFSFLSQWHNSLFPFEIRSREEGVICTLHPATVNPELHGCATKQNSLVSALPFLMNSSRRPLTKILNVNILGFAYPNIPNFVPHLAFKNSWTFLFLLTHFYVGYYPSLLCSANVRLSWAQRPEVTKHPSELDSRVLISSEKRQQIKIL